MAWSDFRTNVGEADFKMAYCLRPSWIMWILHNSPPPPQKKPTVFNLGFILIKLAILKLLVLANSYIYSFGRHLQLIDNIKWQYSSQYVLNLFKRHGLGDRVKKCTVRDGESCWAVGDGVVAVGIRRLEVWPAKHLSWFERLPLKCNI